MLRDARLYDLTQETQAAMLSGAVALRSRQGLPPFDPSAALMQLRRGFAESPAWFLVQAEEFAPEPLTVDALRVRDVYASEAIVKALLELMASERWLDIVGEEYTLTETGAAVLDASRRREEALLADFIPIPRPQIGRLESLLARVIEASLASAEPAGTWSLAHSRRRAPASDAPVTLRLFHHFSDLNAVRDDAHMAAFLPHGLPGHMWEAFSYVCNGPQTAQGLYDQLAHRGHSQHEYARALTTLSTRGWVRSGDEVYVATETGLAARAQAEQLTDRYFYAGWSCLDEREFAELVTLLRALKGAAAQQAEQP